MSYFLRVLCQSAIDLSVEEVRRFVGEGGYFDDPARVAGEAGRVEVTYHERRRPIVLSVTGEGPQLHEELAEIREEASALPAEQAERVRRHLDATRQIIAIDVDRERLTDDAWEMLDSLQGHLASRCGAIVYAPDDGFYDASLQPLGKLPA